MTKTKNELKISSSMCDAEVTVDYGPKETDESILTLIKYLRGNVPASFLEKFATELYKEHGKPSDRMKILEIIEKCQRSCAEVLVSIGTTRGSQVDNETIVIKECPPAIINDLKDAGFLFSMTEQGLEIESFMVE